ncbi:MAG: sodium-dependent transporter [Chitinophagales bacterium]|nr:sodium-dependent transporter [Chitinophagales bacterium]MDW8273786.1 sodium-dependent transporter [Chitinophagales bacterium]
MKQENWGSRIGLILAMAGNAVGFGNFLRFPVQAIKNGGGAFIIPYLVCFILMGVPLLLVEWGMGRYGGKHGHHSTPFIMAIMGGKRFWKYLGVFGIFTNIAVAAYYCYLESWTLSYVFHSILGTFSGMSSEQIASFFGNYVSLTSIEPFFFWVLCLLINTWILSRGLEGGIEKAAKIGMPLLLIFGLFLAVKGVTIKAGHQGASFDGTVGLNFLWTPDFKSIWDAKVWLAAAGQIFFTLSVGMGSIQCYASYLRSKDDVALNAMSAGWMNEFVEVVLGSAIVIPISIGYLGIDKVIEMTQTGGLGLGFKTLPYLFQQWGSTMATLAGVMWFGLLFFAGITSSLAMGAPWISFMRDEFGWRNSQSAWIFGIIILLLGFPAVVFFNQGVFDEYDYWAGTVSLVVFALAEIILFGWIFGIDKGWKEITEGAEIKVPIVFKYIIKFVTPLFIGAVFIGSLPDIIGKIRGESSVFVNMSRILLLLVFGAICAMVRSAHRKRQREGRNLSG